MGINFSKVNFGYYIPKRTLKQKMKKIYPEIKYNLKNVDLNIKGCDEFVTILGHTGSGKSTLVQLMNALNLPSSGKVNIFGYELENSCNIKLKPVRQKVGLVFQFPEYQIFEETSLKDIEFGPKNFGFSKEQARCQAFNAAKLVGLDDKILEKSPFNLSGGQMRKVAISGIIASNPEILVLDEPTVGLDPQSKRELLQLLMQLNQEMHKSIVVITHDMEVVSRYSKRSIVLNHGQIVYDGSTKELFKHPELKTKFNLDYPRVVKMMMELKKEFELEELDVFKFTEEEAFLELKRVFGEDYEH